MTELPAQAHVSASVTKSSRKSVSPVSRPGSLKALFSSQAPSTYIILLQHAQDLLGFFIRFSLLFFDVDDMRGSHV